MQPASLALTALLALPFSGQEWSRVEPGIELSFPRDHGSHPAYKTEWWYLTGQVATQEGRRFGFQFTVFRSGMAPGPAAAGASPLRARQVYAGHLALTDVEAGRTRFAERLRRAGTPLAQASEQDLDLVLEDWSLRRDGEGRLLLSARDPGIGVGLELELVARKPLVLHGVDGYSTKGSQAGNASAYASWTRLETGGQVQVDGRSLEVDGQAWFDHEFGSSMLEPGVVGWDWFGLHLADGRELMLFQLRLESGEPTPASAGTLVAADGTPRPLDRDDFHIEGRSTWTSPRSGAEYPSRWRLAVPSAGIELDLLPLVPDCELTTRSTGVIYWEGPVEARGGTAARGYAELTGYSGSMGGRL